MHYFLANSVALPAMKYERQYIQAEERFRIETSFYLLNYRSLYDQKFCDYDILNHRPNACYHLGKGGDFGTLIDDFCDIRD